MAQPQAETGLPTAVILRQEPARELKIALIRRRLCSGLAQLDALQRVQFTTEMRCLVLFVHTCSSSSLARNRFTARYKITLTLDSVRPVSAAISR